MLGKAENPLSPFCVSIRNRKCIFVIPQFMSEQSRNIIIAAIHQLPVITFSVMTKLVQGRWFDKPLSSWSTKELIAVGIDPDRATKIIAELPLHTIEKTKQQLEELGVTILTLPDTAYPLPLREIPSPPPVLYIRGSIDVLRKTSLAVVGTRKPSDYGLSVTKTMLPPIIRAGVSIVSGLALGIDGLAHRLAVDMGGSTVAVLGCGIDTIYPWDHRQLTSDIIESGGAVISEFPLGSEPERHHFPQRNRIIAGLSKAILLIEAGEKSGALITAKFAVDQNRDVLSIPGNITSPQSIGPNSWLKLGATPITTPKDILRVFNVTVDASDLVKTVYHPQSPEEASLIECLRQKSLDIDELAEKSRLDSSVVSATLSLLEINGVVHHHGGLVYSLA